MINDWLLVETLGSEPAVVALGRQLQNLVPITAFLRRNAGRAAIQSAIAESLQTSQSLASLTPKNDRVIHTEPVVMSDGRVHGVHVWSGPAGDEPPERPIPGPLKWDMTRAWPPIPRSRWPTSAGTSRLKTPRTALSRNDLAIR